MLNISATVVLPGCHLLPPSSTSHNFFFFLSFVYSRFLPSGLRITPLHQEGADHLATFSHACLSLRLCTSLADAFRLVFRRGIRPQSLPLTSLPASPFTTPARCAVSAGGSLSILRHPYTAFDAIPCDRLKRWVFWPAVLIGQKR